MPTAQSTKSGWYVDSSVTTSGTIVYFPAPNIPAGATIKSWYFSTTVNRNGGYAVLWSSDTKHVLARVGSGTTVTYKSASDPETDLSLCNMSASGGTPYLRFGSGSSSITTRWSDGTIYFIYEEGTKTVTTSVSPSGSGTLTANRTTAAPGETVTLTPTPATGYHFSSYTSNPAVTITNNRFVMPSSNVNITAVFAKTAYTVTTEVSPSGGGTLSASKTSNVNMGDIITLTPSAAAGYKFSSYTISPSSVSISSNKFTMPAQNVTVTANFTKVSYTVSKTVSPANAGSFNVSSNSAVMGTTITMSGNTAASGYVFDHYEVNNSAISGNSFTMPAGAVTVKAVYNKLTTGTIDSTNLAPGTNTRVTLTTGSSSFTHQVIMSFGSNAKTWTVAAGVTTLNVSPEASWANSIPNAVRMTGGSIIVKTLKSGSVIGQTTISNALVYNVPNTNDFYPSATSAIYVLRTIAGVTYPNVGNIFVQNKSGVEVRLTGCAGAYGSTVTATEITVQGYTGADYKKTGTGNITLQSGLLTIAGTLTVKAKVTDSRGRAMIYTHTSPVYAYADPYGTLTVTRCNSSGTPKSDGLYAKYSFTSGFPLSAATH